MENYSETLYRKYFSSHILPRKGGLTAEKLKDKSVAYQKRFSRFLPRSKESNIVDLGCGDGSIVWWLQQLGFPNTYGVDISEEQVKVAHALGIKNVEHGDIEDFLKDREETYDVIFLRDIIEHFKKDDVLKILSLCYASLRDEGLIIIQTPNAESPFSGRMRYGDFTHEVSFTTSSLSQLLRVIGFESIHFFPPPPPLIYTAKSLFKFILWKIVEVFYKMALTVEVGRVNTIVTQNLIATAKKL